MEKEVCSPVSSPGSKLEAVSPSHPEREVILHVDGAASQWSAAIPALYLAINRFGSGFDFDNSIERIAVRAME